MTETSSNEVKEIYFQPKGSYLYGLEMFRVSDLRRRTSREDISAKEYVSRWLGLEAKRLLIRTDWPVCVIADYFGFNEATHFSKFFRRIAEYMPQHFQSVKGSS